MISGLNPLQSDSLPTMRGPAKTIQALCSLIIETQIQTTSLCLMCYTWKHKADRRLPGLLVSRPGKFPYCFRKLLMGPVEMMDVNSSSSHRQCWIFLRALSSCVHYTAASIQEAKKTFSPACICWNHYVQCSHKSYK